VVSVTTRHVYNDPIAWGGVIHAPSIMFAPWVRSHRLLSAPSTMLQKRIDDQRPISRENIREPKGFSSASPRVGLKQTGQRNAILRNFPGNSRASVD